MKKLFALSLALAPVLMLAACDDPAPSQGGEDTTPDCAPGAELCDR